MAGVNDTNPDPDAWVEIQFPNVEGTYRCHPDAVPHWTDENHGGQVVVDGKPVKRPAKTGSES